MRTEAERVKLVLAESGDTLGGTERVVWELATRLPEARFDVEVWLSPAPGVDELAASLVARRVAVRRVAEVDSRWDWGGMLRTWRELRRSAPRLLHLHHVWPAADRYLSALADAAGIPHLVVTEHIVGRTHSAPQRRLKRRELDHADAVTAVCGAVADSLARDYGVDRARLRVVPNGADLPDLEAERPAGDGSLRRSLEQRAEALGLTGRVEFLGRLDEIGPLLLAADAVVLPSLWEGLPLIVLEALARARPVVASATGGVPDVIEDGVSGRLVPPGDPAALADALESFHGRPDGALKLGRAGEQRIIEGYTWERVVEAFEMVYDDVLGLASVEDGGRPGRERGARGRA